MTCKLLYLLPMHKNTWLHLNSIGYLYIVALKTRLLINLKDNLLKEVVISGHYCRVVNGTFIALHYRNITCYVSISHSVTKKTCQ